jgi:subtilisin family serine protease
MAKLAKKTLCLFCLLFLLISHVLGQCETDEWAILYQDQGSKEPILRVVPLAEKAIFACNHKILIAQKNCPITELRGTVPDDAYFENQWWASRIHLPEAWDFTTGGLTARGDTVVIAIIDAGFDLEHEDLKGNLFINTNETADDGIDNDANGYTDDMHGWNIATQTDAHPIIGHGTNVAGFVAAVGNNDKGIAGVNWMAKWLPMSGINDDASLYAAAIYIAKMRTSYDQSAGMTGAYVVSVNISLGVLGGKPAERPLWCQAITVLGDAGIIVVGAAPNADVDVDTYSDLPCACPNSNLITVSASDQADKPIIPSAYGAMTIDLVAPGVDLSTTTLNQAYRDNAGGCSFAAPQVAGAVALLYSIPGQNMSDLLDNNQLAMNTVTSWVLGGVESNFYLTERYATEGRLDVFGAVKGAISYLGQDPFTDQLDLLVYPNPRRYNFPIKIKVKTKGGFEYTKLTLFMSDGREVYRWQPTITDWIAPYWELPSLPLQTGCYYLVLQQGDELITELLVVSPD